MKRIQKFRVVPYLPEELSPLMKIARNMWWAWSFEAIELFRRLDVELWREVDHNPIALLGALPQKTMNTTAKSESFIAHMNRVEEELDTHLESTSWFEENRGGYENVGIAYFSAEFGIHESIPIYSGGLGVLAGDHMKSASELGLPLTGIGLLYRNGYFHQYLSIDGWQQETFPRTDFNNIPITPVLNDKGAPVMIDLEFPGRVVHAQIWEVQIGRVNLYLLDTDIPDNADEDRAITFNLYGGDNEMRIKQEMVLGIGGIRALKALGKDISIYHMNEGHSAFLSIERIRSAMIDNGLKFKEALEYVSATSVFTTHTPVPAGNDRFSPELVDKYLGHYYQVMNIKKEDFLGLGRENPFNKEESFCMTVLAIKTAAFCNGVSKLHGVVSRDMWKNIWPSLPVHEVPIDYISNGIQTLSWTSDEMMRLLNRYLGPRWIDHPVDKDVWLNVDSIPDGELWRCRERLRERLVEFSRRTLTEQLEKRGAPKDEIDMAGAVLNSDALTIGFARRFATYKRATLIMKSMERLEKLLLNKERPIQIIMAGKAHPKDDMGKELIKHIVKLARDERFRDRIVFLEDYDLNIARYLVQGVDIWLNTPVRPMEASGTSGMKVVPNGGLNISIPDGWWAEAFNGSNGWNIGHGESYDDKNYQDMVESESLYDILERDVIPLFYNRSADGFPREWIKKIKESMKTICPIFNTNRMVREYTERFYLKAHGNSLKYSENNFERLKTVVSWKEGVFKKWNDISITDLYIPERSGDITVGESINVRAVVNIGQTREEDIQVELFFGNLDSTGEIVNGVAVPMSKVEEVKGSEYIYEGRMLCLKSGQFGFTVRAVPNNQDMVRRFESGVITWA